MADLETGKADLLAWLLEPEDPSARYLTLTELLGRSADDRDVITAQAAIPGADPARSILEAQFPGSDAMRGGGGYWVRPGTGYSPKYRATVWQVIFLAQLGAPSIEPIRDACKHVLAHSRWPAGQGGGAEGRFVAGQEARTAVNCLNGNLLWALGRFGYADDPDVIEARQATAQVVARYGFTCHYNGGLPCAWGDIKVLRAFLEIPPERRTQEVRAAIKRGVELLLDVPLVEARYPTRGQVSQRWFKLGFPLAYHSDVLEALAVLTQAGQGEHACVQQGIQWLLAKQDQAGRWALEQVPGKMWASFGQVGQPNKWVTLRALKLLEFAGF